MAIEYILESTSIMEIIETTIRRHWDKPAYSDFGTDTNFTYGQVAQEIHALHAYFRSLGLGPGDRIALCDRNSSHWGIAFFAALRLVQLSCLSCLTLMESRFSTFCRIPSLVCLLREIKYWRNSL